MTNALVNFKKICSPPLVRLVSLAASLEAESKKNVFRLNHRRLSRKAKYLIAVAIVAVLLISGFAFLSKQSVSNDNVVPQSSDNPTATPTAAPTAGPTPSPTSTSQGNLFNNQTFSQFASNALGKPAGLIEPGQPLNSAVWDQVAEYAWAYFQPGVGVDPNTGLPYAGGTSFEGFTDWDLGCYIQAIIDANETGLIGNGGAWGSSARIDAVLTFLETRTLNAEGYPYEFYDATTGQNSSLSAPETVDGVDTGRLLVALNNLILFNSSLQQPIDNIVLYGRSNYAALVPGIESLASSASIYAYYIASGYASFFPTLSNVPPTIMNNIFSSENITTYGVSLPEVAITGDPLLMSIFELNNNSSQLMTLSKQVYLASEAYYDATGDYAAFGEGNSQGPSGAYIWEWVVFPNGYTWVIANSLGTPPYYNISPYTMSPVIYNKVAFSFLALYNTTYAVDTVAYLEQCLPLPTSGYYDGADNSGNPVSVVGSNTNSLILDAALYAIQNNP